ncbi:MAG: zinc metallopeptidase [Bacilli bacterium]|nr:zinc metallopeptidase [Bacilli bacterium]
MLYMYLLLFLSIAISTLAQVFIKIRYNQYSEIKNSKGITGVEVAQEILKKNGLEKVYVVETQGYLSDHFDPTANVVRLSSDVFHGNSIAAASIAAHECGHAIQHKEGYGPMKIRSSLVPMVNLCSKLGYVAILIGVMVNIAQIYLVGIVLLASMLLFQFVTLPVEFDASKRGLVNLDKCHLLTDSERKGASKVLVAAALTYVASLITTLLEIARLLLSVMGDRD